MDLTLESIAALSHTFNKTYDKEGIFDKSTSKIIDKAFKIRENADYQDFYVVSKKDTKIYPIE